jgi:hypothetical protein
MIDKQKQVAALIEKMTASLPIPTRATDALARTLKGHSVVITPDSPLEIVDVVYMGDEGGICCALKAGDGQSEAFVVSITHLRFGTSLPLYKEILAYQTARTKKLGKSR